jgi:protein SCO1
MNISNMVIAQDTSDTLEVGIAEHLGSTIPTGLFFTTEANQPVQLKDVLHKPTILSLIYFDCPGVCPQILASVSDVIENIQMELGKDYRVVTVSFNSQDTPERALEKKHQFLHTKSKQHPGDWLFLTGDSSNIHQLTNAVGFKFKQAGNDFIHPACIVILSPEGKITRYLYGTSFLPFDVKMALIEAQKGLARPTINRVLDFCYSYDPVGRRYSLEVTKVSGIIILFCAIILLGSLLIRSRIKIKRNNDPRI